MSSRPLMSGMRMSVIEHIGPIALERRRRTAGRSRSARNHVRLLQCLLEHPADRLVVVHDPDAQARSRHQWRLRAVGDRQSQLKHRSAGLALEFDQAAVAADEVLGNREPEPGARRPARDERIEDRLLELVGNAGAVVLDLGGQHQPICAPRQA